MSGRLEQVIVSVFERYPDAVVVYSSLVTADSFILNEASLPAVLYLHPVHEMPLGDTISEARTVTAKAIASPPPSPLPPNPSGLRR